MGVSVMKRPLSFPLMALGLTLVALTPAVGQSPVRLCFGPQGGACRIVTSSDPLPITGTISATASATLPSLSAGSGKALYESLSGGLFVQPVIGSTIVSASAGVPVVAQTSSTWTVVGAAASGAALSGNPVRVGMSDGTNAQNWLAAIALGDGVNGNNTGAVVGWLWNGSTYDRARGDATNGAWVNVKAGSVTPTPTSSAATTTAASVGVASAQALASGTRVYLAFKNESTSAFVACTLEATAALNTAGSITLPPYASWAWEGSYIPSNALSCIASGAATPLTIVSK